MEMYDLSIEFTSYRGESKDDTIELSSNDISLGNIQKKLNSFTSSYYDEGYNELDPRDFNISASNYNMLRSGVVIVLNGCLKISLEECKVND